MRTCQCQTCWMALSPCSKPCSSLKRACRTVVTLLLEKRTPVRKGARRVLRSATKSRALPCSLRRPTIDMAIAVYWGQTNAPCYPRLWPAFWLALNVDGSPLWVSCRSRLFVQTDMKMLSSDLGTAHSVHFDQSLTVTLIAIAIQIGFHDIIRRIESFDQTWSIFDQTKLACTLPLCPTPFRLIQIDRILALLRIGLRGQTI